MNDPIIFILVLFLTLLYTRIRTHVFDPGKGGKRSNTLTAFLRRKIKLNIHHIHFGLIFVFIVVLWVVFWKFNTINLILLAVGISLFLDEIYPSIKYLKRKEKKDFCESYFSKKSLITSILFHLITAIIAYLIF